MKLLLLHGPALASSRAKLNSLKQAFSKLAVSEFPEKSSAQEILGSLATMPMFSEERVIILENPPDDLNLGVVDPSVTIICWFDKEISEKKEIFKFFKQNQGQILLFPESKEVSVFPFLDLLGARDKKAFLEMRKLKNLGLDNQYLITMVFYLLRSLVAPNKNSPDFVKRKVARQRANFSDQEIEQLYKTVLELDFKIKSGLVEDAQAEYSLVSNFVNLSSH